MPVRRRQSRRQEMGAAERYMEMARWGWGPSRHCRDPGTIPRPAASWPRSCDSSTRTFTRQPRRSLPPTCCLRSASRAEPGTSSIGTKQQSRVQEATKGNKKDLSGAEDLFMQKLKMAAEKKSAIDTMADGECNALEKTEDRMSCYLIKALANVGAELAHEVPGHVSTVIDSRLAYDTQGIIQRR